MIGLGYTSITAIKANSDLIPLTNIHSSLIKTCLRGFAKTSKLRKYLILKLDKKA